MGSRHNQVYERGSKPFPYKQCLPGQRSIEHVAKGLYEVYKQRGHPVIGPQVDPYTGFVHYDPELRSLLQMSCSNLCTRRQICDYGLSPRLVEQPVRLSVYR